MATEPRNVLAITGPLPLADFVPLFPVSAFSPSSSSTSVVNNPMLSPQQESRYGRKLKRPELYTPPSQEKLRRKRKILKDNLEAIPVAATDFDSDNDIVDDTDEVLALNQNSDISNLRVLESLQNMAVYAENFEPSEARPQPQNRNNQGFRCPFNDCKGSSKTWLAISSLAQHMQAPVHAGRVPPEDFLHSIGTKMCDTCQVLQCVNFNCLRGRGVQPSVQQKHPPATSEEYIPGQLEFSPASIISAIKTFPPGSSGCPSGWRASHLKDILKVKTKISWSTDSLSSAIDWPMEVSLRSVCKSSL